MPAASYTLNIYSNDGTTLLQSVSGTQGVPMTVTETGVDSTIDEYTYSGTKKFLGLSTSANATIPTYTIGDEFLPESDTNVYIVEGEQESTSNQKLEIIYNNEVIATLNKGDAKVLKVKDFKMEDDLVFEIVEEKEEESFTFTIHDPYVTLYTFPLSSDSGVNFYDLNRLYDITNSVYISVFTSSSEVYLTLSNNARYLVLDNNYSVVYGTDIVFPNSAYYTMAGGSN